MDDGNEALLDAPEQDEVPLRSRAEADALVLGIVQRNADSLRRVAHRYAGHDDDAQDAYQRTLEILLRRAPFLDAPRADKYAHTVCKHEALGFRKKRTDNGVGAEELDTDRLEAAHFEAPEERVLAAEHLDRTAEALRSLKPQELEALWHQAQGKTYRQIAEDLSWSMTKVNRCITEGRKALLTRTAALESGADCVRWDGPISRLVDGEADADELARLKRHLRGCTGCRATVRHLYLAKQDLAALLPPVLVAGSATSAAAGAPAGAGEGLLARLTESVGTFLGERATTSALKVQALVDALGGGKVAAVAASAAAVAGGGVAVEQAVVERPAKDRPATTAARVPASSSVVRAIAAPISRVTTTTAAPARSSSPSATTRRKSKRSAASTEFGSASTSGSAASREFAKPSTASSSSSGEFGAAAPSTSPTSSGSGSTGATSPSPTPASSTSGNGAEFGF